MIKIGFSTSNSIVSRIIRFFTRSKISHCWLLFYDDALGRQMLAQASLGSLFGSGGFAIVPFDKFSKANTIIDILEPVVSIDEGFKQSSAWLGESYDLLGLLGNIFVLAGRWLKRKWHNPFRSSNTVFCSDVIVDILQLSNYPDAKKIISKDTNPEDLYEFLKSTVGE